MKPPFFLIAALTAFNVPAQCQILEIFQQAAEQIKEYDQQIAALELLLTRQHEGYDHIVSHLNAISTITGAEYSLHQDYYGSLPDVNPDITQLPEIAEFPTLQSLIIDDLTVAKDRWRQSGQLTSNDQSYILQMYSTIINQSVSQYQIFNNLTSAQDLTMTDDQRMQLISQLYLEARLLYLLAQTFIDEVDLLILNRKN